MVATSDTFLHPHISKGLLNHDWLEWLEGTICDIEVDVESNDTHESTECWSKAFINCVKLIDEVEIAVFQLRNIVKEILVMVSSKAKTVDGEICLEKLSLNQSCRDSLVGSTIETISQEENTGNWVAVLPFL